MFVCWVFCLVGFLIPVVQGLKNLEKTRLGRGGSGVGIFPCVYPDAWMCPGERRSEAGATVVPSDSVTGRGLTLNIRKHYFFYCEGDQELAQAAQGSWGLAVLGDTQKLPGFGAAWGGCSRWPCLSGGLDQMASKRSLPSSAVL